MLSSRKDSIICVYPYTRCLLADQFSVLASHLSSSAQGVRPHGHKFDEDLPGHAKQPTETVGIWHLQLDSQGEKVKDIFFLRQLSPDEAHRKVNIAPPYLCPLPVQ